MPTRTRSVTLPTLLFLLLFFFTLLLLRNAPLASASVRSGISLCLETLIPSLFPFMVLSEALRALPAAEGFFSRLAAPLTRLLAVSPVGGAALLQGLFFGAPVGAMALLHALESGRISRAECERLLGAATVPSPAFLIGAVGTSLLGSTRTGVLILLSVLLSSLLSLLLSRPRTAVAAPPPLAPSSAPSAARLLTHAVRASARALLTVCAFVLFFSLLSGALGAALSSLPRELYATLAALLELSDGSARAAALGKKIPAACLSAFAAGWSGLSIHAQIYAICEGHGLSFRSYFLCKAVTGILSALLVLSVLFLGAYTSMSFI